MTLDDALRTLLAGGATVVTAAQVAAVLWPDGRTHNANGQVFPLGAGIAGRMLRRSRSVCEVRPRQWEIVRARLMGSNAELTGAASSRPG